MRIIVSAIWVLVLSAVLESEAQEKGKDKIETVKLLYRTKFDALAPSSFTIGAGSPFKLKITWDIPEKAKKELDALIADLEKKSINGVEFECKGVWLKKGIELRVTSVPELTKDGKKRIEESKR